MAPLESGYRLEGSPVHRVQDYSLATLVASHQPTVRGVGKTDADRCAGIRWLMMLSLLSF
jgi:hypothetical protein